MPVENNSDARSLDRQFILLAASFAMFWAWTDCCFFGNDLALSLSIDASMHPVLQLTGLATSACVSALCALAPLRIGRMLRMRKSIIFLTGGGSILTMFAVAVATLKQEGVFVVVLSSAGIAMAAFMFACVDKCTGNSRSCEPGIVVAGSIALGGVIELVIATLPTIVVLVTASALPLLGGIAFLASGKPRVQEHEIHCQSKPIEEMMALGTGKTGLSWRFIVAIVVFSIAAGLMQFFYVAQEPRTAPVAIQMRLASRYCVAFVVFVGAMSLRWKPYHMYRTGSLITIASFLALPFLPQKLSVVGPIAVNAGYTFLELMVWTVLFESARVRDASAIGIVGVGRLVMAAASFAGVLIDTALSVWSMSEHLVSAFASVTAYLLTIASMLVIDESRTSESWYLIERSTPTSNTDALSVRCRELADQHGLTAREYEVLVLLASGRSAPYIGNELGIATSTVNFHVRHIYEKLGSHSKQEIIDTVTLKRQRNTR